MKVKNLLLADFIDTHDNWEELLTAKPYCIRIKREDGYIIFSYSQIDSDFYNPIVRECRGVILNEKSYKPVCVPFFKFGNYGEGYVPDIDWASARTQEKVDGSLIKLWYDESKWRVSTNGNINAYSCEIGQVDFLNLDCPYKTFGELFDKAKENANLDLDSLNKTYTYMFELVSPYNKVVITYDEIAIYHIGTRNNETFEELDIDIGIKKPKNYDLHTLKDCVESASVLPYCEEGYVVVDKNWNRIKIKSPQYVTVHHLKNNGDLNTLGVIELIRTNEVGEFLTYFPEFTQHVEKIRSKINSLIAELDGGLSDIKDRVFETQKDFALYVKNKPFSGFYFCWRKDNTLTAKDWFWKAENGKIKDWLK